MDAMQETEWQRITMMEKEGSLGSSNVIPADTNPAPDWGKGGPVTVPPSTTEEYERVHFWFDLHCPFNEPGLTKAALTALRIQKPHTLVIGGDGLDLSLISKYSASERKAMQEWQVSERVKGECDAFRDLLGKVRRIHRGPIHYVEGNHCQRLREWCGEANTRKWLGMDEHNVTYHNRAGFWLRPDYLVKHGDYVPKHTALKEYTENHCGGASGHKHTDQMWKEVFPATGKKYQWNSFPTMSRLDYDYGPGSAGLARWPQGIGVGDFSTTDPYDYNVRVGEWWKDQLWLDGRRYQ